jgi:hypothetical protein
MKKRKKLTHGDIFYLELPCKKYVIGKVLFDVEKQSNEKSIIFENETYMNTFRRNCCQLIEMYKGIYDQPNDIQKIEVLIPRVFVYGIDSKANNLPYGILAHEKIDYTKVEFPEVIGDSYEAIRLMRGELPLIIEDSYSFDEEDLGGFPVSYGAEQIEVVTNICLYIQGREDLIIGGFYRKNGLKDRDLLYHPELRRKLYKRVGADPNKSYYELALSQGYDLSRFYE